MRVVYSVTYDNGDYNIYIVDEPFSFIDGAAIWVRDTMREQPTILLGHTAINIRHVRSISVREDK